MKLGTGDCTMELTVVGLEFPHDPDGDCDGEWLMVRLVATHPQGDWEACDAFLTVGEAEGLAHAMHQLATGAEPWACFGFIEPNLGFNCPPEEAGRRIVEVTFQYECGPPWTPIVDRCREPVTVAFETSPAQQLAGAEALRAQIAEVRACALARRWQ